MPVSPSTPSTPSARSTPVAAPSAVAAESAVGPRRIRLTMLGIMLAMLLAMLDNAIVGTAMPTIVGDLGGLAHISWVVTAYALATAVSTPVWGKFGDLFGRKRVFLSAIVVFLLGSVLAGAATSMTALISFRAVQGLGAGGIGATAFALVGALVPPRERGRYQGMTASVMAIGTVGGPLLGGFVTGHLGWRWAFYLNLPLGLLAVVWCAVLLRLPAGRAKARIDWPGIVLLTATIGSIVLAASWAGTTYAWGSWQILSLGAVGVLGLVLFVGRQRRAAEPVLPLRIFADRNVRLVCVMVFAAGAVMFGATLYLPLFQQSVQGASATNSGLLLLPMMVPIALVSNVAGKVMSRTGRYRIFPILGAGFLALSTALLATMGTATPRAVTGLYLALAGIGLGFLMQMTTTIAQNSVEPRDLGVVSAATQLFRTVGGSLGVALFGALFTHATAGVTGAAEGAPGANPGSGALAQLPAAARAAYLHAVATGTQRVFMLAAAFCAVALVAALLVKEVPLRGKPAGPAAAGPEPVALKAR
ncbi:MDR family MFS transporter [Kitasatospora sp. NBC_01302]|uniref:MDR family MFS transporter n=1 Tax=Kitasatospora sp. NBC_01302 TaxID=2903575 RepID=UPI003FA3A8A5